MDETLPLIEVVGPPRLVAGSAEVDLAVPSGLDGPDGILQGGFAAAMTLVAARAMDQFGAPPTYLHARLHRPTPMGALLTATLQRDGVARHRVEVRNGDDVTVSGEVELAGHDPAPRAPDLQDLAHVPLPEAKPQSDYPNCVVCGTQNPHGMRIVPHPAPGDRNVAPWAPGPELDRGDGMVDPQAVAAALDCPGVWANWERIQAAGFGAVLLGDFHVRFFSPLPAMEALRTVAIGDGRDGRKFRVRSAVVDPDGLVYAVASAIHVGVERVPPSSTAVRPLDAE